jgi:hypothetical protein
MPLPGAEIAVNPPAEQAPPVAPEGDQPVAQQIAAFAEDPKVQTYLQMRTIQEAFYDEDAAIIQTDTLAIETLVSIASRLSYGALQFHGADQTGISRDALRDDMAIFYEGQRAASQLGIKNYIGCVMTRGRRHLAPIKGCRWTHLMWWTVDPSSYSQQVFNGKWVIDMFKLGVNTTNIAETRTISILEGEEERRPDFVQILEESKRSLEPLPVPHEGRLREPIMPNEPDSESVHEETQDMVSTIPEGDGDEKPEGSISSRMTKILVTAGLRTERILKTYLNAGNAYISAFIHGDPFNQRHHWLDLGERQAFWTETTMMAFPVERQQHKELSKQELQEHHAEVEVSHLTELEAWVRNTTCKPRLIDEYQRETGLQPLPSRWVDTWKIKSDSGKVSKSIKGRLCIKGFAERGQDSLHTASPTASRIGHRLVCLWCAMMRWPLYSYDVATAFLQGWTFAEVNNSGFSRQRCAFRPPAGTFDLLARINKEYEQAAKDPTRWCLELLKAAYGLKDAPLLWFLCISDYLRSLGMKSSAHDSCLFMKIDSQGQLELLMSLHVDDTLLTGLTSSCIWLKDKLEAKFGAMKQEQDCFKHFGLDVLRDSITNNVTLSQKSYLDKLQEIQIDRKRGDGRTAETAASEVEIAEYRSLVAGIAWVGVTDPAAQAGSSMYQNHLPNPTIGDIVRLNAFLDQLKTGYQTTTFRSSLKFENLRLTTLVDSSLGNAARYSQGGQITMISNDEENSVCGNMTILSHRSAKSKRVAASTMAAETLSLVAGLENGQLIQTWMKELMNPRLSASELLALEDSSLMAHDLGTDCADVYEVITSPTFPAPTNKSLVLYLSCLREAKLSKQVRSYFWMDTQDNITNGLTKVNKDGSLPIADLRESMRLSYWEPKRLYKWNGISAMPNAPKHVPCICLNRKPETKTDLVSDVSRSVHVSFVMPNHYDISIDDEFWKPNDQDLTDQPAMIDWTKNDSDEDW